MELILFGLYLVFIIFLIIWFQRMLKEETGKEKLSTRLTIISYMAAFGVPGVIVGVVQFIVQIAIFILV